MRSPAPLLLWALAAAAAVASLGSSAAAAGTFLDGISGCTAGSPLPPTDLKAEVQGEGLVLLSWTRRPCAAYTVAVFPAGTSAAQGKVFKTAVSPASEA